MSDARHFFIALICIVITVIIYWQDILPLRKKLIFTHIQEKELNQQLQKMYYQEVSLEEKMSEIPETKMRLNLEQKKFIKYRDLDKLLKEIVAISKRDQLQIKLFDSLAVLQENVYLKRSFKIVLVGNYSNIARFIEQIANLPWTVVIGHFSLSKILVDETYSTELLFYVYYLNE